MPCQAALGGRRGQQKPTAFADVPLRAQHLPACCFASILAACEAASGAAYKVLLVGAVTAVVRARLHLHGFFLV